MDDRNIVTGQTTAWSLASKLGEGDAGEVYTVRSINDGQKAILKRPRRSAFQADILRQSNQIQSEARVLSSLKGFRIKLQAGTLTVPKLLDIAKTEYENSADFFIIIEKAGGFDLDLLSRLPHMQPKELFEKKEVFSRRESHFLASLIEMKKQPEYIFLRCLDAVVTLFEEIHHYPVELDGVEKGGILWNDVKPDHIFWNPETSQCMIIDWGNAQFLEMDGTTRDRLFTASDDYMQMLDGLGKFLKRSQPGLFKQLDWPDKVNAANAIPEIQKIRQKIEERLISCEEPLGQIRVKEKGLLQGDHPRIGQIRDLQKIQVKLLNYGEYPDYDAALELFSHLGKELAGSGKMVEFHWLAEQAQNLPGGDSTVWRLLYSLSSIGMSYSDENQTIFLHAIEEAFQNNWTDILWLLMRETQSSALPVWYPEVSRMLRVMQLEVDPDSPTPLEAITHFARMLEDCLKPSRETSENLGTDLFGETNGFVGANEKNRLMQTWLNKLRNEIIPRWKQPEPAPPFSGLEYRDLLTLAQDIGVIYPAAGRSMERNVYQPVAQVNIILDAWERKEFDVMKRALRRLLLWDPERLRVLHGIEMLEGIDQWLDALSAGPVGLENALEYATRNEVIAREYRSRIGPAGWLDRILAVLKSLRQGNSAAQAAREYLETCRELSWLRDHIAYPMANPQQPVGSEWNNGGKSSSLSLERKPKNHLADQFFHGFKEAALGEDGDMVLCEPLDLWKPEAQGSSARVFQGFVRMGDDQLKQRAIKVMRPNQVEYALPLFSEEVRILKIMQPLPGITPLFEFGFIKPEPEGQAPDQVLLEPEKLTGQLLRYGWENSEEFIANLPRFSHENWLPYLAMEKKNYEANLLILCDSGHNQGNLMPVKLGLLIAIQICDILAKAHANHIVYRDHKILHYYWQQVYNGVFIIDWNVAKLSDRPLTDAETQFDLVQFGARALHHILTGRPAPGALPAGPTRPDEIEQAPHSYSVSWSFDDQRLSDQIKRIIEKTLAGGYTHAKHLKQDLLLVYHETP